MASILQIESLTKSFGDRILFNEISFGIAQGEKIGIIAKNGTGKSTLLKIITGEEDYDSGKITSRNGLKTGYLEQVPHLDENLNVIDVCISGDDAISAAIRRYESALISADSVSIAESINEMDTISGWDYEMRFKKILSELKIYDLTQRISQL